MAVVDKAPRGLLDVAEQLAGALNLFVTSRGRVTIDVAFGRVKGGDAAEAPEIAEVLVAALGLRERVEARVELEVHDAHVHGVWKHERVNGLWRSEWFSASRLRDLAA